MYNYKFFFLALLFPLFIQAQVTVSGDIVLPNALPVCNVLVELLNADNVIVGQDVSEEDGTFQLTNVPTGVGYTLRFTKEDPYLNGVSTFDIVLLARIILGIDPGTIYQRWAADVNGSGTLSTLDMILLRKLILAIDTTLPLSSWAFDAPDVITPDNQVELPTFTESVENLSVIGVKRGDLNNNAIQNCQ
jgi:hypothetical protein